MCVIFYVTDKRPTEIMIDKAWNYNPDGAGVAYRAVKDGKKVVKWKKGIEDVKEVHELCAKLPTPFIVHFRHASVGGVTPELTHPFPISHKSSLFLEGETPGYVLFHNGDWKEWAYTVKEAALKSGVHVPRGICSDTRAMAWLSSIYGVGFMQFLPDQRGIAFGPEDMEIFTGKGWTKVNDIWCSNDTFLHKTRGGTVQTSFYGFCRYGTCTNKDLDTEGYCKMHPGGKLLAVGSGGAPTALPFRGTLITVTMAEKLHSTKDRTGQRLLGKGVLKRVKKLHRELDKKGTNSAEALRELQHISRKLTVSGLVH